MNQEQLRVWAIEQANITHRDHHYLMEITEGIKRGTTAQERDEIILMTAERYVNYVNAAPEEMELP